MLMNRNHLILLVAVFVSGMFTVACGDGSHSEKDAGDAASGGGSEPSSVVDVRGSRAPRSW